MTSIDLPDFSRSMPTPSARIIDSRAGVVVGAGATVQGPVVPIYPYESVYVAVVSHSNGPARANLFTFQEQAAANQILNVPYECGTGSALAIADVTPAAGNFARLDVTNGTGANMTFDVVLYGSVRRLPVGFGSLLYGGVLAAIVGQVLAAAGTVTKFLPLAMGGDAILTMHATAPGFDAYVSSQRFDGTTDNLAYIRSDVGTPLANNLLTVPFKLSRHASYLFVQNNTAANLSVDATVTLAP